MAIPLIPQDSRPTPRRAKRLNDKQVQELIQAYTDGATVYQLGDRYGIDRRTVGTILKRNGVDTHRHPPAEEVVQEAIRLYEQGSSLARIAEQLDVSYSTLRLQLLKCGVKMRGVNGQERS